MKRMTQQEKEQYRAGVLKVMTRHVGRNNAISMADLFRKVFDEEFNDKINDTRRLRDAITALRDEGVPICSDTASTTGGYYLSAAGSDARRYCDSIHGKALRLLAREARMRKTTIPELLGQIQLELTGVR